MKVRYYGDKIEKNNKAISLCGPTTRSNKIISWRKEAIDILKNIGYDGIVYIPEAKDKNFAFKTKEDQLFWERECYINSNVIVFWVPRKFSINVRFNYKCRIWLLAKKQEMYIW